MRIVKHVCRLSAGIVGAAVLAFAGTTPAAAQTPEQFYSTRTLTLMLGHPPGGSYHLYATLAANHLKRHIPGNPNIIIEQRPGGGGVRAARHFYSNAPRDGSAIALLPETMAHTEILQPDIGQWKMLEMTYIGNFSGVGAVLMRRANAPAKTIDEMRKIPATVGCTGKTSQAYQTAAMMRNLGGFQLKIICGYPGSADYVLALTRGEIDMATSAWLQWRSTQTEEIAKGNLIPMMQTGLRRNRELPDLPLLQEVVDDPTAKRVIEFLSTASEFGRALLAPPGVPADRIAALRAAFDSLVKDAAFLKDAERAKAQIDPTPGEQMQRDLIALFKAPKDIIERARVAMD
ncbi:MAG: hypothetical protein IT536_08065 [Hyphomicrobiales bacterium]|nr:hypothetical protein [Hyphomicrobiales bacterium]